MLCLTHPNLLIILTGQIPGAEARSLGIEATPKSSMPGIFFRGFGHENISMAILPLPLIPEERFSVKLQKIVHLELVNAERLAKEQCG